MRPRAATPRWTVPARTLRIAHCVVALDILKADGFPRTVEFYFRDNRVDRIEWNYRATE